MLFYRRQEKGWSHFSIEEISEGLLTLSYRRYVKDCSHFSI